MTGVEILSSLGGIVSFLTAVILVIRWVARLIDATEDNTEAMGKLNENLTNTVSRVDEHDIKIAVLMDRINR